MGILDQAIAVVPERRSTTKSRVELILDDLRPHLDDPNEENTFEQLDAIVRADVNDYSHATTADILRHLCDHYGVKHRDINSKNVEQWRGKQRQRGSD